MKKLLNVLVLTLALNFIAVAGGIGYLFQSGKLDKSKTVAIREMVFATTQPAAPAAETKPKNPTTGPSVRLEELLASKLGAPASEQVEFIRNTFDAQMAQLDQRERQINNLLVQAENTRAELERQRAELNRGRTDLQTRQEEATRLQGDKGFQDSLQLYTSMPAKQAKQVFMTLDDKTVMQYLQAMPPRTASKIIREFKAAEEVERITRIMEQMRQAQLAAAKE